MVVNIQGYEELTPKEQNRCILKLRELTDQRDELAQSSAVDANMLTDKLNQVERSRSATPVLPPWDPFDPDPERVEEDREMEEGSQEALIKDNGRPCYPIELGFDVFNDPGQYKNIFEYWQYNTSNKRQVFSAQWFEWEDFRYVAEQSPLADWMEYQDYKLRQYEDLEERPKNAQEGLVSKRKKLADEGYSPFEGIDELEFGEYFGISQEWSDKLGKIRKRQELWERKLTIAKKRLEVAQSEELGERFERDRWIEWFQEEVESRRSRLDELQRAEDEAKRDEEPYKQWVGKKRPGVARKLYNKQLEKQVSGFA